MLIRPYQPADEAAVVALWAACDLLHPLNDPRKDIGRKLADSPDLFLVGTLGHQLFAHAPPEFAAALGPLPDGVELVGPAAKALDFAILFVTSAADLQKRFGQLAGRLVPNGMLWVSWPKRASGVATDLDENVVRRI